MVFLLSPISEEFFVFRVILNYFNLMELYMIASWTIENLIKISNSHLKSDLAEKFFNPLTLAFEQYNINNAARIAAFLGQVFIESTFFSRLEENLNYKSAERLHDIFPRAFASLETAKQYIGKPEKIANRVYSSNFNKYLGNGDENTGDGWRYRGRGLIQVTGKYNYTVLSTNTGINFIANPELLLDPAYACISAAHFFKSRGLNELADQGSFDQLTEKVNKAKLELAQRSFYYQRGFQILGA